LKKFIIILWSIVIMLGALPAYAAPAYPKVYEYYMELGKRFLEEGDYREAINKFQRAQLAGPHEKEPVFYINLIKRLLDDRIEPKPATENLRPVIRRWVREEEDGIDLRRSLPSLREAKLRRDLFEAKRVKKGFKQVPAKLARRKFEEKTPQRSSIPLKQIHIKPKEVGFITQNSIPPKAPDKIIVKREKKKKTKIQLIDEAMERLVDQMSLKKETPRVEKTLPKEVLPLAPEIDEIPHDIVISKSDILSKGYDYDYLLDDMDVPFIEERDPVVSLPPARIVIDSPPEISSPRIIPNMKECKTAFFGNDHNLIFVDLLNINESGSNDQMLSIISGIKND